MTTTNTLSANFATLQTAFIDNSHMTMCTNIQGAITIGEYTFNATQLGQLLHALQLHYPELKI